MDDRQENKLSMYYTVIAACDRHIPAWTGLPGFADAHTDFQAKVAEIAAQTESQQRGSSGASKDKGTTRDAMARHAHLIASAIQAWAFIAGDFALADQMALSETHFRYGRDTESEKRARLVHKKGTEHLAQLGDYGVTQPLLDQLDSLIGDYHKAITAPRLAIIDQKAATAALQTLFPEADQILNHRMDKLIPVLALTQPAFVTDYRNARIIVDD